MKKLILFLFLILTNLFSTNIAIASSLYMITGVDDTGTTSGHVKKIGPKKWEYCDNYTKDQIRNTYINHVFILNVFRWGTISGLFCLCAGQPVSADTFYFRGGLQ